jgi:hypothetical protein
MIHVTCRSRFGEQRLARHGECRAPADRRARAGDTPPGLLPPGGQRASQANGLASRRRPSDTGREART